MKSIVCTLFEGSYEKGLGALINSMYRNGFRGVFWVGFRGILPEWAKTARPCDEYQEYQAAPDLQVRFVKLDTKIHFTIYKPHFMLTLWEKYGEPDDLMFYLDPDIIIRNRWTFFEEWVSRGLALCEDINHLNMSSDNPLRLYWNEFLERNGMQVHHKLERYFNGGFLGVPSRYIDAIALWKRIEEAMEGEGVQLGWGLGGDRTDPFNKQDQDALNLMAMASPHPLTTVGPECMGFVPGGFLMYHAVGAPKPWESKFIPLALNGRAPSMMEKCFYEHVTEPIQVLSTGQLQSIKRQLLIASALCRFIHKN